MVNQVSNNGLQEGRLQRKMSSSGVYVSTFRQIMVRHGLTMAVISLVCLILTAVLDIAVLEWTPLRTERWFYLAIMVVMLLFFGIFLAFKRHKIDRTQCMWLVYLLLISTVEELSFRLILPALMLGTLGIIPAVVLSNLVFASIHFFTLRWKFVNCLGAFLGGLGLSRLLANSEDILLVILVHWFFTFLNTPTAPKDAL